MTQGSREQRREARRRLLSLGLAVLVAALALWTAGIAAGAVGGLTYQSCTTGETQSGPGGSGACALIPSATAGGSHSGLATPDSMALSPDGTSLYAVSALDSAVARFDRDPATGALTYQGCISGDKASGPSGSGACALIPSAAPGGFDSGLASPRSVALSPDGTSLYAVSALDSAVARFDRDPASGALAYQGCISGDKASGPSGSGACAKIPSATKFGDHSGLYGLWSVTLSPDGEWLYTASQQDNAVSRFKRDPATGAVTYRDCISGETQSGPAGSGACAAIPSATKFGLDSGLAELKSVAVSADGASLYAVSFNDSAVASFKRNPTTGRLTYKGCISGDSRIGPAGTGACEVVPSATEYGLDSGLALLSSVAVSADGKSVYTAGGGIFTADEDDQVARFRRNPTSGRLTYQDCLTGETESGPGGSGACEAIPSAASIGEDSGLDGLTSLALSGDGESLYATARFDDAVASFKRNPTTGRLTYQTCLTGEKGSGPGGSGACAAIPSANKDGKNSGLDSLSSVALSLDGESLYATAGSDAAVARFDREIPPPP
jgi:6-phosphogluconolactonase (cycloisomerase 2 family)